MNLSRPALRACVGIGVASAALLFASPASAHVTVDSPDAAAGDHGKAVFRVPTESETASTTKLTVDLPKETPFAFVSAQAKPGWKVSMKKTKHGKPVKVGEYKVTETVSQVTWTAKKGHGVAPGEFDEFALSVGPFPKKPGKVQFSATQRYTDGSTVAWDEPVPESGKEPEHPAPTLTVPAASSDVQAATTASGTDSAQESRGMSDDDGSGILAPVLSAVALLVALIALVLAMVAKRGRS